MTAQAFGQSFTPITPLPDPYSGHQLVSNSGFLYQVGGLSGSVGVRGAARVLASPLQGSGANGAWVDAAALPEGVYFHAALSVGQALYVLGGNHFVPGAGISVSNKVYFSKVNADGTLAGWQQTVSLPEPVYFLSAALWNNTIYVIGGYNGQALTSGVYSANIQPDGSLGAWTAQRFLPEGRYTHAAVSNGTLYVLGGTIDGGAVIDNTVYYSQINPDKTLGPWNATTPMPQPVSNHRASLANGLVLVTGGYNGSAPVNAANAAPPLADGNVGSWASFATLPQPLYLHGQTVANGYLFVSGGSNGSASQTGVYSIPLPPPPKPADVLAPRTTLAIGSPNYGTSPEFVTPASAFSLSAVDDALVVGDGKGVGVASTWYAVDAASFTAYQGPFTLSGDGAHWVRYYSVDLVGNVEAVHVASAAVDATAPVSSVAAGSPQAVLADGSVIVSAQTSFSASAADPVVNGVASGVASLTVLVDQTALNPVPATFNLPATDGAHTVTTQATDNLGNAEAAHTYTFYVDKTAPVTTASVSPAPYVAPDGVPVLGAASVVSLSGTDPVVNQTASGVNHTEYSIDGGAWATGTGVAFAEGAHTLAYRSVDNVGNVEAAHSAAYRVDLTPPQTTLAVGSPAILLFGQNVLFTNTSLALTAQDPVSNGVASGVGRTLYSIDGGAAQAYSAPFTLPPGQHAVSFYSVDNAGNAEAARSETFLVSPFLSDALEGLGSVTLSGNASVTGTVRTNGTYEGDGKAVVQGDVWAMTASLNGQSKVTGTVHQGAATLPTGGFDLAAARAYASANNNNASVPSQYFSGGALSLSAQQQLTLPAGVYFFSGLSISGQASLEVSGPVQIFVAGDLSVSGGGKLNDAGSADDLWIFSDGSQASVTGGARSALHLFAPSAAVSFSGRGEVAGRILGQSVTLSGNSSSPSSTTLPPYSRDPGSARHLAKAQPGSGSGAASFGESHGQSQAIASSNTGRQDPAPGSAPKAGSAAPPALALSRLPPAARVARLQAVSTFPLTVAGSLALSIVASGGDSVRSADKSGVVIPPGAVSAGGLGVSVVVNPTPSDADKERQQKSMARRNLASAGPTVQYGPEGTQFAKPVTLELAYDPAALPAGVGEDDLTVHYWDPVASDWQPLASQVDKVSHVVRAQTTHFSLYGVLAGARILSSAAPFQLGSIYAFPNPARRGKPPVLHVEAGSADRVKIRIYDVSGALKGSVELDGPAGLIDDGSGRGPQPAFEYSWDVSGVGSGVYLFTVTAEKDGLSSLSRTGKLAVIK